MKNRGLVLTELLMVLAIVGIFFGMVISNLPRGDVELRQATRSFSLSVQKARSEAIRSNKFAGIVVPTNSSFSVFIDENTNRSYDNGIDTIVSTVNLKMSYPSLSIAKNNSNEILFEPRGFVWGAVNQTIVFSSVKSDSLVKVIIGLQGQVQIQKVTF